jgi:hypothetical protein
MIDRDDVEPTDTDAGYNPNPQVAPGASTAVGHGTGNSIPLSIFPITVDKFCICFAGLPGRGKTYLSRRLGRYLSFFHAMPVQVFNDGDYEFCRRDNSSVCQQGKAVYDSVFTDMTKFLNENISAVAIFDSTSCHHKRRTELMNSVRDSAIDHN